MRLTDTKYIDMNLFCRNIVVANVRENRVIKLIHTEGRPVLRFVAAAYEGRTQPPTTFACLAEDDVAERLVDIIKPGTHLLATGRLYQRWSNRTGNRYLMFVITDFAVLENVYSPLLLPEIAEKIGQNTNDTSEKTVTKPMDNI